jgi:hypothetical protein
MLVCACRGACLGARLREIISHPFARDNNGNSKEKESQDGRKAGEGEGKEGAKRDDAERKTPDQIR